MFKIMGLFVIVAVASSAMAKAAPKPDVIAYSAPAVLATAPAATFFEQSFHGHFEPAAVVAAPASYQSPPLAYSYPAYEPFVATAPATAVLLK